MGKGMRWVSKISRRGEEEEEEDGNSNQEGKDSNEVKYERDKPTVSKCRRWSKMRIEQRSP